MRLNVAPTGPRTFEGGPAVSANALHELRRTVLTCLLWENTFYEPGSDIGGRIRDLVRHCPPEAVAALAVEARDRMYLRHAPLLLVRELARLPGNGALVADTLERVVQRPDELTEYLAIYWQGVASGTSKRPTPLSAGSKRGLARAFAKFSSHQLAKYDRDGAVKLRDVLRLTHPKPKDADRAAVWKSVIARDLEVPDTWEVALSGGADKKETFERLLREGKLGSLAFIRNLRNMVNANVSPQLIRARFAQPLDKALPFRYIAAARHAAAYASELNDAMLRSVQDEAKLPGLTAVLVDISGSMDEALSAKSEMKRMDAAAGVAVLIREIAEACRVFTFSDQVVEVANFRGLPMVEGILRSQPHNGTLLGAAVEEINRLVEYERLIVVTDEQSQDAVGNPKGVGYIVNVAPYAKGVGFGKWTRINGWSERVIDFIREIEVEPAPDAR